MKTLCVWLVVLLVVLVSNDARAQPTAAAVKRNADPKIVGGWPSKPGSRPFQAALVHAGKTSNFDAQFCGGSIIGGNAVLTAAHCVLGKTAADVEILSGTDRLMVGGARTPVVKIAIYARYDKATQDGDIAVVTTKDPLLGRALALATEADELEHAPVGAAATGGAELPGHIAGGDHPDRLPGYLPPAVRRAETPVDGHCADDLRRLQAWRQGFLPGRQRRSVVRIDDQVVCPGWGCQLGDRLRRTRELWGVRQGLPTPRLDLLAGRRAVYEGRDRYGHLPAMRRKQ